MNKRGFTLVEVISVIALLGLLIGIAVPNVMKSSKKAKERTLLTKIENIEKAAVLYGQDNRNLIDKYISGKDESGNNIINAEYINNYKYCFKDNNLISNCYYYEKEGITTITVKFLAEKGYIQYDEGTNIKNSTDESKSLNGCEIQIYQKYGKIYAVYLDKIKNTNCWVQE